MFFDLQVNGYAGVDFNSEDVSAEQLHHVCAALKAAGVIGFFSDDSHRAFAPHDPTLAKSGSLTRS